MPFNVGEDEVNKGANRKPHFSRTYTTTAGIVAGAASVERFISEEHEWQHAPFDALLIVNLDNVDLALRMDGNPDNLIPVKKGLTVGASDQNFRNFTIENLDGATAHTAGKILITVQNTRKKGNV